jgi:alpha-galactosidase
MWRLQLPEDSNWPAAMFITQDGSQAVLFHFQVRGLFNAAYPRLRLRGLDAGSQYEVEGLGKFGGASLMNQGIAVDFEGDYDSRIMFITRQ